ncbi:Calcium-transporting ATPase 12, plasma membrane-type [Camellia lanceoleosa]|uniref:Calcium-transporting ATPase 12, plasma membrane-type n=1 Tax=Camellia lanceoleosa TaxID=1840588 RepID=A0ACC0HFC1_9ERIC|nr:Calcium-transporting ATPase 12, plasma membrane-type [Camellia lanceoleosa]
MSPILFQPTIELPLSLMVAAALKNHTIALPPPPLTDFSNFDPSSLIQLVKQKNLNQLLVEYEGIAGVANALITNLGTGIYGGDEDTKNEDGTIDFVAGKTKFHDAITSVKQRASSHSNQMKFWLGQQSVDERVSTPIADSVRELLYQGVSLNTTDTFCNSHPRSEFEFSDKPIEKAILSWAVQELNMDFEEVNNSLC